MFSMISILIQKLNNTHVTDGDYALVWLEITATLILVAIIRNT